MRNFQHKFLRPSDKKDEEVNNHNLKIPKLNVYGNVIDLYLDSIWEMKFSGCITFY